MKFKAVLISLFENNFRAHNGNAAAVLKQLGIEVIHFAGTKENLLADLQQAAGGADALVIAHSDSRFYSPEENKRLLENFEKYDSDFGFGDNFPSGVLFDIVRTEALPVMENLRVQKKLPVRREILKDIIEIDINMFDLENLYSPVTLRTLRLSFFEDNPQDAAQADLISSWLGGRTLESGLTFKEFGELINANRNLLRALPRTFEFDITTRTRQPSVIYSPRPDITGEDADGAALIALLPKIGAWVPNAVIMLSARMGEPLLHPQLLEILKASLACGFETVLETSGADLSQTLSDALLALDDGSKLKVIFFIDAAEAKLYSQIRGSEIPLSEIRTGAEYFLLRRSQGVWVQTVKMIENYEHLPAWHKDFSRFTSGLIVQKYDRCRGLLAERRLNPAEPFEKIDCWHLKRDMSFDVKGNLRRCRQDVKSEAVAGHWNEDLKILWQKGAQNLKQHCAGWDWCKGCDEYYTYFF